MDHDVVTAQYFYRGAAPARGHRHSVSAYLVERLEGSTVVARIETLGLAPRSRPGPELAARGRRRDLEVAGRWQLTTSGLHARVLLRRASGAPAQRGAF